MRGIVIGLVLVCASVQAGEALDAVRAAYEAKEYEKAVELAAAVAEKDRDWDDAQVLKGEALVRLHRLDDAEAAFRAVVEAKRNHADALVGIGKVLNLKQKHAEAEVVLRQALKADRNHLGALQELGGMLAAIGRGGEGRTFLLKAWKLDKKSILTAELLFEVHLEGYNDRTSARKVAEAIVKAHKDRAEGHWMLARLHAATGKNADAVEAYVAAAEAEPDRALAHARAATACHDAGRKEDALRHYARYVELGGKDEDILRRHRELQA